MMAGFLSDDYVPWIAKAKRSWLELEDVNILHVTWSESNRYFYSTAVADTPLVARQITIFLYYLAAINEVYFRDPNFAKNIHFVGHSLGAHIGGFVGQDFGGLMGRITGLDPAGPSYDTFARTHRLDKTDALLVDVIHTNAGRMKYANALASMSAKVADKIIKRLPGFSSVSQNIAQEYTGEGDTAWFGIDQQVGHIDYYANDGRVQPGCEGLVHVCDHNRATDIFNAILRHEIDLMKSDQFTKQKHRRYSRLLSFNSIDFNSFTSGANFEAQSCQPLMHIGEHLTERVAKVIQFCSLPIDVLSPVEELRDELSTKYNVAFNDPDYQSARKYYFRTLPQSPFVGDHYLLKLYLNEGAYWNSNECSLSAKIAMGDGEPICVEMRDVQRRSDGSMPDTLALPFVNPYGVLSRDVVNDIVMRGTKSSTKIDQLHYVLPSQVTISITSVKTSHALKAPINFFIKFIKGHNAISDCHLPIGMIEVHPIVEWSRNFAGLYGDSSEFNVYTTDEQVKVPWRNDEVSRMNDESDLTISRKLNAMVIHE